MEETAMTTASLSDITRLSVAERIQLAEDIRDTVVAHPEEVRLSESQTRELERFPYSVFYVFENHRIVVLACFHASR